MEVRQRGTRRSRKECIGTAWTGKKVNGGGIDDFKELRVLFDKIVLSLCKDLYGKEEVDLFPPCLSDGRRVDLLKFFEAVRMRGGYKQVNEKGMWDSIAVELGLSCGVLEVIYLKYLNELDQRLSKILSAKGSQIAKGSSTKSLDHLTLKALDAKSKVFVDKKLRLKEAASSSKSNIADADRNDLNLMIMEFAQVLLGGGSTSDSKTGAITTGVGSRKRKRGSMHDLLNWVIRSAKHPVKSAAEINQKSFAFYGQSLLARQVLFVKGPEGGKENSQVQVIISTSCRKLQYLSLLFIHFLNTFKSFFVRCLFI